MKEHTFFGKYKSYDLLKICSFFSKEYGTCLLFSGGQFTTSKKSYLFLFPFESFSITHKSQKKTFKDFHNVFQAEHVWEELDNKLTDHFWSGFLSYEMGAFSDKSLTTPAAVSDIPLAYFQRCLCILEYDHRSLQMKVHLEDLKKAADPKHINYAEKLLNLDQFLKNIPDIEENKAKSASLISEEDKSSYFKKIQKIHKSILSGEVYQLNLSHEIKLQATSSYFDVFYSLVTNNPTPFSAYFYLNDTVIVSNSPERLLQKKGLFLETRPIKGTIKRGNSKAEETLNSKKLLSSEKERAELIMITDLLRNDLSKVSISGSVATKPCQLEKYENIIHMLSVIKSKADPSFSSVEILREVFPGGSITGCPKLKAKELIYAIEKRPRNIYTGSIGYLKGKKDFDFNICIRTILFNASQASIQLGGAIVHDSDDEAEYFETLIKGMSIFQAINYKKNDYCLL